MRCCLTILDGEACAALAASAGPEEPPAALLEGAAVRTSVRPTGAGFAAGAFMPAAVALAVRGAEARRGSGWGSLAVGGCAFAGAWAMSAAGPVGG